MPVPLPEDPVASLRERVRALRAEIERAESAIQAKEREHALLRRFAEAASSTDFSPHGAAGIVARTGATTYISIHIGKAFHDGDLGYAAGMLALGVLLLGFEWWNAGRSDESRVQELEEAFVEAARSPRARVGDPEAEIDEDADEEEEPRGAAPASRKRGS